MNPYRVSLDKSWGGDFRVGQWVRYTGEHPLYNDKVGRVEHVASDLITVSMRSDLLGLQDYGCYPVFLERVEREEIRQEMKERNQQ